MNVQDVVTRVRRTFGDEAAVQITNDDVIRWINDAQVEIVKKNDRALEATSLLNLVAGQATYSLPADMLVLRSLRYKMPDMQSFLNLTYKNMQEFDIALDGWDGTTVGNSKPIYFTMYEDKAVLFPTPDTSVASGLKVLYNQQPVVVDDLTDVFSLPLLYHNSIFKYCMWQAGLLDEDHEPALMYRNDFQSDMDDLLGIEVKDPSSVYPTITVRPEDM